MGAVLYEKKNALVKIRMNRPEVANSVNDEMIIGLNDCMRRAIDDREVRVVIFCSTGKNFCGGEDLNQARKHIDGLNAGELDPWEMSEHTVNRLQELSRLQLNDLKVCIAAVQGWAVGAGWEFALACDLIVAAEDAKFSFRELKVGATISGGGTWLLPQIVGRTKAREWTLLGDTVTAEEACRAGMVNKVVPVGQAEKAAEELANTIIGYDNSIIVAHKRLLNAAPDIPFSVAVELEKTAAVQALLPGGMQRGVEKFLEAKGK